MTGEVSRVTLVTDARCALCSGAVAFVLGRLRREVQVAVQREEDAKEWIVIEDNKEHRGADGWLHLTHHMTEPYRSLGWLVTTCIPRWLVHYIYAIVARNRYRWFGRSSS